MSALAGRVRLSRALLLPMDGAATRCGTSAAVAVVRTRAASTTATTTTTTARAAVSRGIAHRSKRALPSSDQAMTRIAFGARGSVGRRHLTTSTHASRLVPDAASVDYCRQLVREADYEAFLVTLLAPAEHRTAVFTLHAFNIELQQVRQQTHGNPLASRMRYQWWREVIHAMCQGEAPGAAAGGGGGMSGHPVVDCLRVAVRDYKLTQRWLEHILESHMGDMDQGGGAGAHGYLETMSDLEDRCERSHSALLYLLLEVQSRGADQQSHRLAGSLADVNEAAYIASHFGVCNGIVHSLRSIRAQTPVLHLPYPAAVARQHGFEAMSSHHAHETLREALAASEQQAKSHTDVVHDIASQAFAHLDKGRSLQAQHKFPVTPYLPAVASAFYLRALSDSGFDVLAANEFMQRQTSVVRLQMSLLAANWRGQIPEGK